LVHSESSTIARQFDWGIWFITKTDPAELAPSWSCIHEAFVFDILVVKKSLAGHENFGLSLNDKETMMTFTIMNVDMNGFLGRENHPHPTDVGKRVTPISLEIEIYANLMPIAVGAEEAAEVATNGYRNEDFEITASEIRRAMSGETVTLAARLRDNEELEVYASRYFRCLVIESGEILDLVDFEVEDAATNLVRQVARETCSSGEPGDDKRQLDILRDKAEKILAS